MIRSTTVTDTFEVEIELNDRIYACNVKATSECTYAPGRTSGLPEDCYPDESEQETTFEILDCTRNGESLVLDFELLAKLTTLLPTDWMESRLWEQYMTGDV